MADTPVINGHRYGWASIGIQLEGVETPDFTEFTYSAKQEIGKVRGMGTRVLGTTQGESDGEGSFTMLKKQASAFIKSMGSSFMKKKWAATVSYDEDGEGGIITDELTGCQITNVEDSPKQGTEPAMTKFDFHIMRMKLNGQDPHGKD